jgi:hypothetical protein
LPLVAGQQGVTIIPDVDINYFFPELTEDSTVHKKRRHGSVRKKDFLKVRTGWRAIHEKSFCSF